MIHEKAAKATLALVFYIFLCIPRCSLLSKPIFEEGFF